MYQSNRKPKMYQAVCDKCNKNCEVPFNPTPGKPIYCSECFEQVGDQNSSNDREMHSAVCDECGDECKVPFKPTSGKPIYCSRCFEKKEQNPKNSRLGARREPRNDSNIKYMSRTQYDNLNHKLSTIIEKLEKMEKMKNPKNVT